MTSRVARHGVLARCGAGGGVWLALLIACATGFLACGTPASVHAATPQDAVAMAVDMISSADPDMRAIGLDRLRHSLRGSEATLKVAAMLSGLPAEQQKELVRAFATRGDAAAIPAITALVLATPDAAVRAAALEGLGGLGSGTEGALLKKWLAEGEPEKSAARRGLRLLRGADVSTQLVEAAHFGEPALRPTFIDILAERGEAGVAATLAALAADPEPAVRLAALKALAKLGGSAEAAPLVDRLLAATANDERAEAERTLVTLCTVNRGKEGATKVFLERFKGAGENTQIHCVSDGAPWIADQTERGFGLQGKFLVDFYHVCDYLGAAAESICPDSKKDWLADQKKKLKEGKVSEVISTIEPYVEPVSVQKDKAPVRTCYSYMKNRVGQFNYKDIIYRSLPGNTGFEKVAYTGEFYPRYLAASGYSHEEDKLYILGGYGSKSGQQTLSPNYYYELLTYSFEDSSFSKLVDFSETVSDFCFANNAIITDNHLYALAFSKYHFPQGRSAAIR